MAMGTALGALSASVVGLGVLIVVHENARDLVILSRGELGALLHLEIYAGAMRDPVAMMNKGLEVIQAQPSRAVMDLFCGTGGFSLEVVR